MSILVATLAIGCLPPPAEDSEEPAVTTGTIEVVARSSHIPTFSCVEQCHADREPNPTPRALTEFHTQRVLEHGSRIHWCSSCHLDTNLDRFTLMDGNSVPFDQAYELCGQCHGDKLRDWRAGIHGLQTGAWNGVIQRRSCPACHDPHHPSDRSLIALPPPERPRGS